MRVRPTFHVSHLKPVVTCPLFLRAPAPPPPRIIEGGPTYTVRRLLDSSHQGRGFHYLVDWEGYRPEERSWVPAWHILDPNLAKFFHQFHSDRPGLSGAGHRGGAVTPQAGQQSESLGLVCILGPRHMLRKSHDT